MKEGWSKQSGTRQRGPYAHSAASKQWVGYDDVEAVARKADYIQERGYGGAAVWTLDLDDFNNLCCQGESCQYCQCLLYPDWSPPRPVPAPEHGQRAAAGRGRSGAGVWPPRPARHARPALSGDHHLR